MDIENIKGWFDIAIKRKDGTTESFRVDNDVTDVGKNKMLDCMFNQSSQSNLWYIGLIDNTNFTAVAAADTHDVHAGWAENTGYTNATRPQWTKGAASNKIITNATAITYTFNTTAAVIGLFVSNRNVKGDTSAGFILWNTSIFSAVRNLNSGDSLTVIYSTSIL